MRSPAAHERQMRIGVAGLAGALLVGQLRAQVQLVVDVAGAGRKELLKDLQVVLDVVAVVIEHFGEAPVQVAGGGVVRDVERLRITRELGPEPLAQGAPDVDEVDAGSGLDAQRGVEGLVAGVDVPIRQDHRLSSGLLPGSLRRGTIPRLV